MTGHDAAQLIGFLLGLLLVAHLSGALHFGAFALRFGKLLFFLLAALGLWFGGNLAAVVGRLADSGGENILSFWAEAAALIGLAFLPALMVHTHWLYLARVTRRRSFERILFPLSIMILYASASAWPLLIPGEFASSTGDLFERAGRAGPLFVSLLAIAYLLTAHLQHRHAESHTDPLETRVFRRLCYFSIAIPAWTLAIYLPGLQRTPAGPWLALSVQLAAIAPLALVSLEARRLLERRNSAEVLVRSWEERLASESEVARKSRLEELGRMAGTVAHSVKNPLSSMKTLLQLLLEAENLTEEQRSEVRMMVAEVDRLAETVSQLLLFSRAEPTSRDARRTDLAEVVRRLGSLFRGDFDSRGIRFECEVSADCSLKADRRVLQDILENLIKNAIEASSRGDLIRVEARREGDCWRVAVEDEGTGIPPAVREQLFQPFVTDKSKGTGLGLSIVRARVDALGGRIEWRPRAQRGTRFILWLPIPPQSDSESASRPPERIGQEPL